MFYKVNGLSVTGNGHIDGQGDEWWKCAEVNVNFLFIFDFWFLQLNTYIFNIIYMCRLVIARDLW